MPRVVRDRRLDRVGVTHHHDRLVRVRGDDLVERVDHARLHLARSTRRPGNARATARPARLSTRRSWRGRRSCRRSSRRSRLRSHRGAAAPRGRGARRCSCAVCVVRSIGLAYTVAIGSFARRSAAASRLIDALLGEIDAGHPTREQRTGVRGDAVPDEHEPRRRLRLRASRRSRRPRFRRRSRSSARCVGRAGRSRRMAAEIPAAHPVRSLADDRRAASPRADRPRRCSTPSPTTRSTRCGPRSPHGRRPARRRRRRVRALAALPRRVGAARPTRPRRRRGLRVLPRRLPPRARPAAPVGLARLGLRALALRDEPRVPARARRPARARPRRSARSTKPQRCDEFLRQLDPDYDPAASSVVAVNNAARGMPVKRALITGITGQDGRHLSRVPAAARATRCSGSCTARPTRRSRWCRARTRRSSSSRATSATSPR